MMWPVCRDCAAKVSVRKGSIRPSLLFRVEAITGRSSSRNVKPVRGTSGSGRVCSGGGRDWSGRLRLKLMG